MQALDYDNLQKWSPWFTQILSEISDDQLISELCNTRFKFIDDARDHVVCRLGLNRIVEHLTDRLADRQVIFHHGTRLLESEIDLIRKEGLRSLDLQERAPSLRSILSAHPRWPQVEGQFDNAILKFGSGAFAGLREDGCVHACFSRSALLRGCSHYLAYGAEVDGHVAHSLFNDHSANELLSCARRGLIVSFSAGFREALSAANPSGVPSGELPSLLNIFLSAWAYSQAVPTFDLTSQSDCTAARFQRPVSPSEFVMLSPIDDKDIDFASA